MNTMTAPALSRSGARAQPPVECVHDWRVDGSGRRFGLLIDLARFCCIAAVTAYGLNWGLRYWNAPVSCPSAKEGGVECLLSYRWAPALTLFTLAPLAGWLLGKILVDAPARAIERLLAGERPRLNHRPHVVLAPPPPSSPPPPLRDSEAAPGALAMWTPSGPRPLSSDDGGAISRR